MSAKDFLGRREISTRVTRSSCIAFFLLVVFMMAMAQKKQFSLEDLNFGGIRYNEMSPEKRFYAWHGERLVRKEIDCVHYVDNGGKEKTLFTLDDIEIAIGTDDALIGVNLLNAEFPYADQTLALIHTPKSLLLYDFDKCRIVFSQNSVASLEWCARSKVDVFSKGDNIYVRMPDGEERQLTTDGSREIVYGRSVHRNEFGIDRGVFFSPDGRKFAFYRMDQTMVTDYPQVNTFTPIASYEPDKYPMAGCTSHEVTVGIYDIDKDTTIWLQTGNPENRYFTNISWSTDGKCLYLIELNRDQNHSSLDEYDAADGRKLRTLLTETDEKYVEPQHPISFLPWDGGKFIYWSQREGYWQLYLYDLNTCKCLKKLTDGSYVVQQLMGFCSKTKSIIFQANKDDLLQRNIYSVSTENGKIKRIDNGVGVHSGVLSESGEQIIDTWTAPDVPRSWTLASTVTGKLSSLGEALNPWKEYEVPEYRQGAIKAADDKTDLYYRMVLPPGFDEMKRYPVIVYVYGGPHAHNIEASWHWNSRSWETYMAQRGYVLFILDNRGSEHRGKEFEQATFRRLGQVEMQDQMRGVEFLKSLPYVDKDRIGIHGWSYGGFMTISLMTNYPDVFKVGVAGGPVIDWSKYEVMYTERYMDTPEQNPDGYEATCLLSKAKELQGRLLIVIGMNDPVVVPQHAMGFLNACNEAGTYPDFYVYPGEEHNMMGHMSVHLHEKITRYFDDFLK